MGVQQDLPVPAGGLSAAGILPRAIQLSGKTLGLIGIEPVGAELARMCTSSVRFRAGLTKTSKATADPASPADQARSSPLDADNAQTRIPTTRQALTSIDL